MHENTGPDSSRVKFWTNRNEFVGYLERVLQGFVERRGRGQFHLKAWTKKARKAKGEQSGKAGNKCGNTAETSEYIAIMKGKREDRSLISPSPPPWKYLVKQ